jgi:hypothetical protein
MNKKRVVLFLTSPNSWRRSEMSLNNFKQIEKLGYDIITLSTNDCLPDYFYKNSKIVIHDYNEHICEAKHYFEYKKRTGYGYWIWYGSSIGHQVTFFHKTHYPSVIRNIKTLILFAKSMGYEEYLYCEDDHYFHTDDLLKINAFFDELKQNDLVVFPFNLTPDDDSTKVYCSYFHFGKLNQEVLNVFKKFAYTSDEFIAEENLYFYIFEKIIINTIHAYKSENLKLKEIYNFTELINNSKFNIVYSVQNLDDDSRCNFIYNDIDKNNVLYYHACGLNVNVDLKVFINDNPYYYTTVSPGGWALIQIENSLINKTKVVLNNKIVKTFKKLNVNDIIYNGEMFK